MILLIRDPSGRLVSRVFDISGSKFSENSVRCINLARKQIRAKIGSRIRDLSPMSVSDFEVSGDTRKFLVPLILATDGQGDKAVIIERSRISIKQGERSLVFLYHDTRDLRRVRYKRVTLSDELPFEDETDDEVQETEAVSDEAARDAEREEGR